MPVLLFLAAVVVFLPAILLIGLAMAEARMVVDPPRHPRIPEDEGRWFRS